MLLVDVSNEYLVRELTNKGALSDSLEAGMARCFDAGGQVVSPIIEIPPGRFAYAKDLDGNSIGLFEPKAA